MESKYQIAWLIYFTAVVAAQLLVWQLLRRWRAREAKQVIQLCLFAFLATPVPVETGSAYWVPAFMAALMEALESGPAVGFSRLWPALAAMLLLVVAAIGGRSYLQRRRDHSSADAAANGGSGQAS